MTPDHACQRAFRWFLAAALLFGARSGLHAVGIDLLDLPLALAALGCAFKVGQHAGWETGYRARTDERKDAA